MKITEKDNLKRSFIVQFYRKQLEHQKFKSIINILRFQKVAKMGSLTPYHNLIVDISSDEEGENFTQSIPLKTLQLNTLGVRNLSGTSAEAQRGSEKN